MIKQNQERLNVKTMFIFIRQDPSGYWGYVFFFFFQAEDGIRDVLGSRGLGDVYKRQLLTSLINYFYVDNTVSLCMKSGRAASLKIQELTETLLSLSTYTLHIL